MRNIISIVLASIIVIILLFLTLPLKLISMAWYNEKFDTIPQSCKNNYIDSLFEVACNIIIDK